MKKVMSYKTPANRVLIYEKLIEMIDEGECFFMCYPIRDMIGCEWFVMSKEEFKRILPELWKCRPRHITLTEDKIAWYDDNKEGMQKRKKRLLKAIQLCKF